MNEKDRAFTAFVRESGTALYRGAMLLTGEHHAAEDLVQATYVRVYRHWGRVRRAASPVAYARTTMTNTFLSQRRLRSDGERPGRADDVATSAAGMTTGQAGGGHTATELRLDLLAALGTLSPLDRAVVVLRYWDDHTVAETAAALGLTEVTVRTRCHRALARLRPHLESLSDRSL